MKIAVPKGACDTHIHFYDRAAPAAPGTLVPGHFDLAMYRDLQRRLGLERAVAVVTVAVTDEELERMTGAGVVAQRFFNLPVLRIALSAG